MKTRDEFETFYQNELKKSSDFYIDDTKKTALICTIISLLIVFICVTLFFKFNNILSFCVLFFIVPLLKESKRKFLYIQDEYKYDIASRIISFLSDNKNAGIKPKMMIAKSAINECELFNMDKLRTFGSHYTIMSEGKFNIILSDLKLLYYDEKKRKREVFNGTYFSASFNKQIDEQVYVIPDNVKDIFLNKFMNYFDYAGVRVVLENNEFERKYNVYSVDELQARYLISLRLMERINDIDKIIGEKKYIVFKKTGKISILFSGESIKSKFENKVNLLKKGEAFKFCEKIFDYFSRYIEIYKILDLENRLYLIGGKVNG